MIKVCKNFVNSDVDSDSESDSESDSSDSETESENDSGIGGVCKVTAGRSFASVVSGTATATSSAVTKAPKVKSEVSRRNTLDKILTEWLEYNSKYRDPNDLTKKEISESDSTIIPIKTALSKRKFRRFRSLMICLESPIFRARRCAFIALDDKDDDSESDTAAKPFKPKISLINWDPNDESLDPDRPKSQYDAGLFLKLPEMSTWEPYGPKNRTIVWSKYPPPMSLNEAEAEYLFAELEPQDPRPKYKVTKELSPEEIEKIVGPMLPNPMSDFLIENGLGRYVDHFIRASIDLQEFRLMTDAELRCVGVNAYLDRKKMHHLIAEMNRVSPPFEEENMFDNINNVFTQYHPHQTMQPNFGFFCNYYV